MERAKLFPLTVVRRLSRKDGLYRRSHLPKLSRRCSGRPFAEDRSRRLAQYASTDRVGDSRDPAARRRHLERDAIAAKGVIHHDGCCGRGKASGTDCFGCKPQQLFLVQVVDQQAGDRIRLQSSPARTSSIGLGRCCAQGREAVAGVHIHQDGVVVHGYLGNGVRMRADQLTGAGIT